MRDSADHELWYAGKRVYQGGYAKGAVSLIDLDAEPVARIGNPFDILQFYLSRSCLEEVADEHGGRIATELAWPRGAPDETVGTFAKLLIPTLEGRFANPLFVDHLMLAFRTHVAHAYGGLASNRLRTAGGLAAWQERRAKELLRERFAGDMSIAEVARECGLSPNHFTRAFRRSTGVQPHRWLSKLRIEEAQRLLRDADSSLADIALACGFGDQSYFTRVFTRMTGMSPGAWRRAAKL
ncbi:AraC family transcriptional regulator [Lichenihabitans sp. Uapishka_5]|uniref:helix-turn-helix domain-containing protein n=1 Tax=Lichenihabitans sp. Uapishka_5 TaxID=3037302 RepID=UPI0029E81F64|nr:AraC family transcriptional regulator [Lichenihabitans sp. Uapishka_5]MDX7951843.1 AraC family transcriptional regulator [Lichenihabitans sp. Uapishka_5]